MPFTPGAVYIVTKQARERRARRLAAMGPAERAEFLRLEKIAADEAAKNNRFWQPIAWAFLGACLLTFVVGLGWLVVLMVRR
jgi:hypothetical protein